MAITVTGTDDAATVLAETNGFLVAKPVEHNLVHTLLFHRAAEPADGRYWIARDGSDVAAVAFLSPLTFFATMTPARDELVDALAATMARDVPELSGMNAEAATSAHFAGQWCSTRHVVGSVHGAQRLYRLHALRPPTVDGSLREARNDEVDLLARWQRGFNDDTGEGSIARDDAGIRTAMTALVQSRRVHVWDNHGPCSMAALSPMLAGAVRVQGVYTPPQLRGHGYASAVVAAISAHVLYDDTGRAEQLAREQAAADRIFGMLPPAQGSALRALWEEFEARETPDARFAAALDRLQPLLLNRASGGVAWRRHGIVRSQVLERNAHIADGAPELWDAARRVIDDASRAGALPDA